MTQPAITDEGSGRQWSAFRWVSALATAGTLSLAPFTAMRWAGLRNGAAPGPVRVTVSPVAERASGHQREIVNLSPSKFRLTGPGKAAHAATRQFALASTLGDGSDFEQIAVERSRVCRFPSDRGQARHGAAQLVPLSHGPQTDGPALATLPLVIASDAIVHRAALSLRNALQA